MRATELYRQAAEKGVRSGQARYGLALLEGRGVARDLQDGEVLAAQGGACRRPGGGGAGRHALCARRRPAAQSHGGRPVVPARRRCRAQDRGAHDGGAAPHRRRRAARSGRGRAMVPRLRRRRGRAGAPRPRGARAEGAGGAGRLRAHPRVVRAGGEPRATWSRHTTTASASPRAWASSATTCRRRSGCAAPPKAWSTRSIWYGRMLAEGRGVEANAEEGARLDHAGRQYSA